MIRRRLRAPRGFSSLAVGFLAVSALMGSTSTATQPVSQRTPDASSAGRAGAEAAAIELASHVAPVVLDERGRICPPDRLEVRWDAPPRGRYREGAYLTPVEAPRPSDRSANGIIVCRGSSFAFRGFEAIRGADGIWRAFAVPDPGGEHAHGDEPAVAAPREDLPAGLGTVRAASPWHGRWPSEIEPLAGYEPQSSCDPRPKVGTAAFRALVSSVFPQTRDLGISRGCGAGGLSEHKEGRAWDWGVNVATPAENAAANTLISWLLATDEHGNRFAMARRLGVMYVIWDGHIWNASRSNDGWRAYRGRSPHTDHVHISFSRDGALGRTSFWDVAPLIGASRFATFFLPQDFDLGGATPPPNELGPRTGETVRTSADRPQPGPDSATPSAPAPAEPAPTGTSPEPQTSPTPPPPATPVPAPTVTVPELPSPPSLPVTTTTTVPLPATPDLPVTVPSL